MDRLQQIERRNSRRIALIWILGLGPLICTLICVASVLACFEMCLISHDGQEHADFRRFATEDVLRDYIEQQLVEGVSTREDVQAFMRKEGIRQCPLSSCLVFAPEEIDPNLDWRERWNIHINNRLFKVFYYEIGFYFERDSILTKFEVNRKQEWVTWP